MVDQGAVLRHREAALHIARDEVHRLSDGKRLAAERQAAAVDGLGHQGLVPHEKPETRSRVRRIGVYRQNPPLLAGFGAGDMDRSFSASVLRPVYVKWRPSGREQGQR